MSLRTARRADRRLREAAKQAETLANGQKDASAARIDLAFLAIKAATAEQLGMRGLRRLTGARAVRAQPLGERVRRHAETSQSAIELAEVSLARHDVDATPVRAAPESEASAFALRGLHGPQLHGFALLLTLGDRRAAAELAEDALAAGGGRADELQQPRQAAAWLRHSVLKAAMSRRADPNSDEATRRATLRTLGVDDTALAALSALTILERGAVVASTVEGLEDPDVAVVVGLDAARTGRLVQEGLRRATGAPMPEPPLSEPYGPIVARTREVAARVLA